jgi:hypothetical protein
MQIRYFEETDTLLIEFRVAPVVETRDLDEDTILDVGPMTASSPERTFISRSVACR